MTTPLSPFHQQLIDVLKEKGVVESAIVRFLQAIDVPGDNTGLRQQAGRIAELLSNYAPRLSGSDAQELEVLCQVAVAIHGIDEIPGNPEFLAGWEDEASPFLHGCYDQHPLYCLLSLEANQASSTAEYKIFLGQFIFAYWKWQPRTGEREHLLEEVCRAGRRLGKTFRRLNSGDNSDPNLKVLPIILTALPSSSCTPAEYLRQFLKQVQTAPSLNAKEIEQHTLEQIVRAGASNDV